MKTLTVVAALALGAALSQQAASQVLSADESLPEGSIGDSADCRSVGLHFDSGPI